ncbi:MAG: tetratricopeptide repeat protein [Actinobacteria bacterium]|nr:tetratricopeptide repeat protein [Actinomycetota bacterium]
MKALPTGTVTFLLTDVEGSTAAWERDPEGTGAFIAHLDGLVGKAVSANSGVVVKARGEGDSHFCVFTTASDAVKAGIAILKALAGSELTVRMGVHTGEADFRDGDYYGRTVNRAARLRSAGHGGQLLLSEVSVGLLRDRTPAGVELVDLGVHRLKDLSAPESIYRVSHPEIPDVSRPLATLDALRNNLPLQLTRLIGRDEEVSEVLGLLSHQRLVSLVALGGTGKTRLALQVAAEASGGHPGGVWYAELAPIHHADQVPAAILAAVGGPPGTDDSLGEAADWIATREVLLVLDNCEHVIDSVAASVNHLLSKCPALKVLTTTRQPLDLAGEAVFRVPPLGLPNPEDPLTEIAAAPAVELFLERGKAANRSFELNQTNAAAIARLCTGLDGLPLAIELAASRLKILDPDQILERLSDRLALVDGSAQPTANRTVRGAIEWSYDLLKPDEATLLRRLAIFEASADFATVEAICGDELPDAALELAALVDHSLVTVETTAIGRRYRLLDLVRAFAAELLDLSGERPAIEHLRADWCDGVVARFRAEGALSQTQRAELLESQADMEAALEWRWRTERHALAPAVQGIAALWAELGRWTIAATWVSRALATENLEEWRRLELLLLQGGLCFSRWEFRDGIRIGEEALALARKLGRPEAEEEAHNRIASSAWRCGDLDCAHFHNEQAFELARVRPGRDHEAATAANNLGLVALDRKDIAEAEAWFKVSLEFSEKFGDEAHGLWRLGQVAEMRGDIDGAMELFERAIAAAERRSRPDNLALAEISLGRVLESAGEFSSSEAHFRAAHAAADEAGDPSASSRALLDWARVAARQGDHEKCHAMVSRAFMELAGEPVSQLVEVGAAVNRAREHALWPVAYDLSRRLLEVTLRDGTAKGAAFATSLCAGTALDAGHRDEAYRLAVQARQKFVALGDVDVGPVSAARRIEECDVLLARLDEDLAGSTLT